MCWPRRPTGRDWGDKPGYLPGFGILPAESVREIATSAKLKPLVVPTGVAALFWHNLPIHGDRGSSFGGGISTVRWPGCDRSAEESDIDHTVPWPYGSDASVEPGARLPHPPSGQDVLCGLDRSAAARWDHRVNRSHRASPIAPIHGAAMFPALARPTGELDIPAPPNRHQAPTARQ